MTPKEKAIELYNKFLNPSGNTYLYGMLEHESAKECAVIAVDEILETLDKNLDSSQFAVMNYWNDIKEEIQKF